MDIDDDGGVATRLGGGEREFLFDRLKGIVRESSIKRRHITLMTFTCAVARRELGGAPARCAVRKIDRPKHPPVRIHIRSDIGLIPTVIAAGDTVGPKEGSADFLRDAKTMRRVSRH